MSSKTETEMESTLGKAGTVSKSKNSEFMPEALHAVSAPIEKVNLPCASCMRENAVPMQANLVWKCQFCGKKNKVIVETPIAENGPEAGNLNPAQRCYQNINNFAKTKPCVSIASWSNGA
jgi:ribosomal protein L37AE/L43A